MNKSEILKSVADFTKSYGDDIFENISYMIIEAEYDNGADISTNFDKKFEQDFYNFTKEKYPEFGFVGEEFPEYHNEKEYNWYVDPIDGTKWFRHGIPLWGNSVALVRSSDLEPIISVLYHPVSKNMFTAIKGEGAFLEDKKLNISQNKKLDEVQIAFDCTKNDTLVNDYQEYFDKALTNLYSNCYKLRILGTGAFSLAWVANGMFSAYINPFQPKGELIDTAAGLLLATEAGAVVWKENIDEKHQKYIVGQEDIVNKLISQLKN